MTTPTFKDLYADQWEAGNAREHYVRGILEVKGYRVIRKGFMTEQATFSAEPHHADEPDFDVEVAGGDGQVNTLVCKVDPTGTNHIPKEDPTGWVRDSKVTWARNNPLPITYTAHVEDSTLRVRWIHTIACEAWPLRVMNLKGLPERMRCVPVNQFMTTKQFLATIQGRKRK